MSIEKTGMPPPSSLFKRPNEACDEQLVGQSELLLEFVAWAKEVNAAVAAHRALARSLILSHPNPAQLLEHFQQGMDWVADSVTPDQIADYRKEMHILQGLILQAANDLPKT